MPENETDTQVQEKPSPQAVSIGSPTRATMNTIGVQKEGPNTDEQEAPKQVDGADKESEVPPLTPEQMKSFFKNTFGIDYSGDEAQLTELKEKLNHTPPAEQPTEDQIKLAQAAEEKEILDLFIANGGTAENFVAIKGIANADVKELSRQETINEYIAAGFDKAEAEALIQERYYQTQIDELQFDEFGEETKEEFEAKKAKLQKKVDFFSAKLDNRASAAKTQAEQLLNNLKAEVSGKKLQAQKQVEFAANVDKHFATLSRNQTFELGKLDGKDLAPVRINVDESDISAVAETLKDPAKLKQFLFNEDGSYNLNNLSEALLAKHSQTRVARQILLEGQTRMTNIFRETYPANSGYELGVGGASQRSNGNGKAVTAGKPQRVNR